MYGRSTFFKNFFQIMIKVTEKYNRYLAGVDLVEGVSVYWPFLDQPPRKISYNAYYLFRAQKPPEKYYCGLYKFITK